jgi:hypothetical protein
MYFTDLVDLQQLDDVKREYTVELGFLAKETMDLIVRNTLVAEGSAFFAGDNTTISTLAAFAAGTNDDRPKIDDFRKIVLGMKRAYLRGNRKAGGRYVALVSPEVMFELFDDERMKDYMDFGQTNAPFGDGMVIDMFGLRFVEVLNAPIVDNETVLAHDSIIIAEESYAITKLQGQGLRVITKGLGSAGVEDPLDQRQSIGWKMTGFAVKVLNNEAVVNYWSVPADVEPTLVDSPEFVTVYFEATEAGTPITFRNSVLLVPVGAHVQDAIDVAVVGAELTEAQIADGDTATFAYALNGTAVTAGNLATTDIVVASGEEAATITVTVTVA